jgi:transposase
MIIRLFELEFSARSISKRIAQSYPTGLKALEILRLAIIANSSDPKPWLDYVYFRSVESKAKQKPQTMNAVFGILEQHGKAKIDILEGFKAEKVLELKPKMLRRSLIYYTDEYHPYEALVFHDLTNAHYRDKGDDSNQVYKVNRDSDFWRFMETKISKYRGISKAKLPHYLKELEFRYNHRNQQIFELLSSYIVSFIPKS